MWNLEVHYSYQSAIRCSVCGLLAVAFQMEVYCRFWLVDMFYILQKKDDPKGKCIFF